MPNAKCTTENRGRVIRVIRVIRGKNHGHAAGRRCRQGCLRSDAVPSTLGKNLRDLGSFALECLT